MTSHRHWCDVTAMRIPFISRLLESDEPSPARWGNQKSVQHKHLEITRQLQQYTDAQHLLTAQIYRGNKPERQRMATGIVRVDEPHSQFMVDDFNPPPEHRLANGQAVHFSLTHMGVRCQFNASYIETVAMPGGNQHTFDYPKGIEHIQLRDAFRVQVGSLHPVRVTLTKTDQPTLTGLVVDLSASGARLRIDGLIRPQPHRGDEFEHCVLYLTDGARIAGSAKLMHWQYDINKDQTTLGIQLTGLNAATQRNLSRYLIDLQRLEQQHTRL